MWIVEAYRTTAFSLYGTLYFTRSAFLKHAAGFKKEDLDVDMAGKNCVVTGANTGIGFASAEALAARGANVFLVCRNKEKGEKAVSEIKSKTGNDKVELELCDLSSLKEVKELATRFLSMDKALYVLVNNAGLMEHERKTTADGLELNFAVNIAASYTLTELLMPALEKAAPESRVVTVSSGGMYGSSLTEDLQYSDDKFNGLVQYSRNKRLQIAMTENWAKLYGSKGVGFYTMHPGWVDTEGVAKSLSSFREKFQGKLRTIDQGADTIVWLSLQPNSKLKSGEFYFDRALAPKHLAACGTGYKPQLAAKIISKVRQICGVDAPVREVNVA
ncbi:hypothetical protein SELMODRAFT_271962 [Selaginella moellendorffii]|uniref:Dehydrogenase/reductase SDR family member 12 n=1 Tax=Selaginella moellendorffii TaxID=88036 RepID=D8SXH7_SELML|nr:dehydrogenase/reductase SDR family member 12 [Selaginella moellendorffii]XP_024517658.1 dehydrogenase/reductase SDR family member 12 [Selaginella moellendorffii]EFJ10807.1 hypothetical protein SELMODRAFT_271962 [Selaginella moellendorffii]|eukprot:XP_002988015.1 dehydrogenase/reductase SDR family member 12 [Selaginella moellendorffii]